MANRSYLYSIDSPPSGDQSRRRVVGLSEWAYAVPLAYKLLVSGSPEVCKSIIWEGADSIAIIGDYKLGLQRLSDFLARLRGQTMQQLAREAMDFLNDPKNQQPFILLECGEIFELQGEDPVKANQELLEEIKQVDRQVDEFWEDAPKPPRKSRLFGWLSSPQKTLQKHEQKLINQIGLGNWDNVLYFHFDDE